LHLKTAVSVSHQRSAGREFHTDGPATEKAHFANLVLVLRTTYSAPLDDHILLLIAIYTIYVHQILNANTNHK